MGLGVGERAGARARAKGWWAVGLHKETRSIADSGKRNTFETYRRWGTYMRQQDMTEDLWRMCIDLCCKFICESSASVNVPCRASRENRQVGHLDKLSRGGPAKCLDAQV